MNYQISVSGGSNDDVYLNLKNPYGGIMNEGLVKGSGSATLRADVDGYYVFEFENSISILSKKQVTLTYEIIKKPVLQDVFQSSTSNTGSSSFPTGSAVLLLLFVPVAIAIGLIVRGKRRGKKSEIKRWKNPKQYLKDEYKEGYESTKPTKPSTRKEPQKNSKKEKDVKNIGILKERLAKGEITKEEYDELKKEFE